MSQIYQLTGSQPCCLAMSGNIFNKLDNLEMGDQVKIHFSKSTAQVNGVTLQSPLQTKVEIVIEQHLDHKKGHDVDGIVTKKEIFLEVPDHDDTHGEYVIETERPMVGDNSYTPIEAREYFEGVPGDGRYSMHSFGFEDIETI